MMTHLNDLVMLLYILMVMIYNQSIISVTLFIII